MVALALARTHTPPTNPEARAKVLTMRPVLTDDANSLDECDNKGAGQIDPVLREPPP
jgi:hypothetical protein